MMNTPVLSQIEESINQLSLDEQLWLMEQLAHRIRENTLKQSFWDTQLAAMAADPEIQNELRKIEEEFAFAEADEKAVLSTGRLCSYPCSGVCKQKFVVAGVTS